MLLELIAERVTDRWLFLPPAGACAAVILVVTQLSLPPLRG